MGFTLVSDYFLVLIHNNLVGVFTFCFVHITYIFRVSNDRRQSLEWVLAPFLAGGFFYFVLGASVPLIGILAVIYGTLFGVNIAEHIKYYRSAKADALPMTNRRIMLAGLILFALCDIHVLMFNLPHYLPQVPQAVGEWGRMWIWVFYAPSQLLLAVSAARWDSRYSYTNHK